MKYSISEIVIVTRDLMRQKIWHLQRSAFYTRLFNNCVPQDEVSLDYTPVMEFYQRMAERHGMEVLEIEQHLLKYQALVDVE